MADQTEAAPVVLHDGSGFPWRYPLENMVRQVRTPGTARSRECRIEFDDGVTVVVLIQRVEP